MATHVLTLINGDEYGFPEDQCELGLNENGWLVVRHTETGDVMSVPPSSVLTLELLHAPEVLETTDPDTWVVDPNPETRANLPG